MERPHFLIVGTQKGGTTWLKHHLSRHPDVFMPRSQIHFFDRCYGKGPEWYAARFTGAANGQVCGEKTTEYFDTIHGENVAQRIARILPDVRLIVILRDPIARALSALHHMVNSGLEPIPDDSSALLFADRDRPEGQGWRYIERGFYARQLRALRAHVPRERIMVLIFEEDVIAAPEHAWSRVCTFIGVRPVSAKDLAHPVNATPGLSPFSIRLSEAFRSVPQARGVIRRIDQVLGPTPWRPAFGDDARSRLTDIYRPHNQALFELLSRDVPAWESG